MSATAIATRRIESDQYRAVMRHLATGGVSLLAEEQQQVCRALSAKVEDKLSAVDWSESSWGNPHIKDSLAWFDCVLDQQILAGDHLIVVASVLEMTAGGGAPLIFHGGRFGSFSESRPTPF
jgi:3-hydroxy-9,10-secoandrosta-1,3,5(10)-triene-9,17-dione monooxygenase reductase component